VTDQPSPELAARLLRAKARELEARFRLLHDATEPDRDVPEVAWLAADLALVADLLAQHLDPPSTRNDLPERNVTPGG
jgi:hypothetical protein